jgi:hypothetical protein
LNDRVHLPVPRKGPASARLDCGDLGAGEAYVPVTCTACGRVHVVNPKTGKVLETGKK